MKNAKLLFCCLLALVFTNSLVAQSNSLENIKWHSVQSAQNQILYFDHASFSLEQPQVPQFCKAIPYNGTNKPIVRIYNLKLEPLTALEKRLLGDFEPPENIEVDAKVGVSREGNRVTYCFTPIVNRNGTWQKVLSFNYSLEAGPESSSVFNSAPKNKRAASASKLSTGDWYKISVAKTAIFKITAQFLSDNGISESAVNFSDIRLLGNGIGMLPERVGDARPDDLREVPVKIQDGNNDGILNGNDFVAFYAKGPHQWRYNSNSGYFQNDINIYRSFNYYFLSVNSGSSAQPPTQSSGGLANQQVTTFDDYAFIEDEDINLVGAGRQWFGDAFEFTLSYNYDFQFPDIVSSQPVDLLVNAIGRVSSSGTSLVTSYLGSQILSNPIDAYNSTLQYPNYAERTALRTTFLPQGPNITLNLTYNNASNPAGVAWLDEIELNVRRNLRMNGAQLHFRDSESVGAGNVAQFTIGGASSDLQVWDVTDLDNITSINGSFNAGTYTFTASADQLREYVAFSGSNFDVPAFVEKVENQNLHELPVPEMIIIAHPRFINSAQALADFHNTEDNVKTEVVSTQQVYNEYSSGGQDIAGIRDFIKDLYDRSVPGQFKYALLFGDASYDYKDRLNGNNNFVPVWQSETSFSLGASSLTDDFYAYLDNNEGEGGSSGSGFRGDIMDIGVGRIPCETTTQANQYIAKVKNYMSSANSFGEWRNRVLLMADDVDDLWERTYFIPYSESLEKLTKRASKSFNVEKIYADAYQQQSTTGSQAYPEASRDMFRKVQQGSLVTNYIGHGGEIGLSSEKLLDLADVNGWTNFDALSLFVTITCEFTRFDDPKRVSAGEQLLLNPRGGAIALLTTTRVVGVQPAVLLNEAVFDTILARPNGQAQTLGQIIKAAKNDAYVLGNATKNKFSLIGDPALRLAIPYHKIITDSINGVSVQQGALDTLKALSKVSLSGQVNNYNGGKLSSFNGVLQLSVFDKPSDRETLVNDGVGAPQQFQIQNNLIYKGKVAVKNGDFSAEFRVPKDISPRFGFGKISYYASDQEGLIDAAGYFDTITVGGLDNTAPLDNLGPEIEIFMNDQSFVRGGVTGPDPFLVAVLRDSSGINTVGNGVGHDLKAVLDEETDQPYVLNEFYEADLNSYQSGEVRYQFFELEEGEHTLTLQAFDIYNNPSKSKTEFIVADSEELVLRKVLNFPNPFTTNTEFQFEHNRANQQLNVQVQIFTVSGKLVKTINANIVPSGNRVTGINWNGLDDYGDKIGKGVYVYRVKVKSPIDNSSADKYEKLVILR